MIGVIRVFTTENKTVLNQHGKIITEVYGLPTHNQCIPEQTLGIYDKSSEVEAIPKIVELGKKMEKEGVKILAISCAADPGIEELRKAVSIPVIGAGSAAALTALAFGKPVGILGITQDVPEVMKKLLGELLVASAVPEDVKNTTDLMKAEGKEKGLKAAKSLLNEGAEVIVFACTGFSTIGLAEQLRHELKVPIIDAVEAEGQFAAQLYHSFTEVV
ncbi:aspartate/glutamate racemase family protein [Niallia sp. FSL W8-0635]|uniref:aspartate/glutamate racemase family protein n=1 Tax=Niallia sp. FSL W8-0635 TaxID=2975337 RepID=UPI0009D2275B|nr:glutamate racemase [Mycobacteroides abscessus subsp. abscessus]HEO8422256.1 aspartate/glutamate racemase family protein [Yersinia enterocolitica]